MKRKKILIVLLLVLTLVAAAAVKMFWRGFSLEFENTNLAEAVESEVIELADGDSFELSAEMIIKELGGQTLTMMGYNGSIPGPTFKVKQGSTVKINFTNNTTIENTIHSHGIRLKNKFDGVPGVTQDPVQPGESFEYEIVFPDPGVYWYHPHVREDLTQEMGLYGAFVVEPEDENYWNEVNREEYIFLDDYLLTDDGLYPYYDDEITHALMGRFGNEFLINGEEDYVLEVARHETLRFTFLNVANVRPFNVAINGVQIKLVGSDAGAYENESFVDSVVIAPSERYLVEAYFDEPGTYELQNVTPDKTYKLGTIKVLASGNVEEVFTGFDVLKTSDDVRDEIPNFEDYLSAAVDKRLRLTVEMEMMNHGGMNEEEDDDGGMHGMSTMPCHQMGDGTWMGDCDDGPVEIEGIEWEDDMGMMSEMSSDKNVEWQIIDEDTGAINDEIDWDFEIGEYVVIEMDNDKDSMHPMQHPIHFHGQRFVILSENGVANDNLVWKDTVLVPTGDTVKVLLEVTNPGDWMAHCHIAEHMHSGMMFDFAVE